MVPRSGRSASASERAIVSSTDGRNRRLADPTGRSREGREWDGERSLSLRAVSAQTFLSQPRADPVGQVPSPSKAAQTSVSPAWQSTECRRGRKPALRKGAREWAGPTSIGHTRIAAVDVKTEGEPPSDRSMLQTVLTNSRTLAQPMPSAEDCFLTLSARS